MVMNITGFKIPTGGTQTSWLFTSMTEELNKGPPRNNSTLVVRAGLKPATSGFQVRRPNHSVTVLFVTVATLYHVDNVFGVAVNVMTNKSSFASRTKCIISKSAVYVIAC